MCGSGSYQRRARPHVEFTEAGGKECSLFLAVAEKLSLTKAAQREHLVLSTASKRIAELAHAVG
jgi:hypothetical protein